MANEGVDPTNKQTQRMSGVLLEAARRGLEPRAASPWKIDPAAISLVIESSEGGYDYDIDLEKCTSSARVLDAIAQVSGKPWIDDATLGALVRKLDEMFELQANLCPGGKSLEIDPVIHLRKSGWIE